MRKYSIGTAIILNLLYIVIGIIMIRTEKGKQKLFGVIPILLGAGTLLLGVIFNNRDFVMQISMFGMPIILLEIIILKLRNNKKCNFMIEAVYVDKNFYGGYRGMNSYGPVFRYTYNGKEYRSEAKQYFTEDQMRLRFVRKKTYNIYICENDPELCVVDKKDNSIFPMICSVIIFIFLALAVYWNF